MAAELIHHRALTLDVSGYKLHGGGTSLFLTAQQTRLLALLMGDPTRVHSFRSLAAGMRDPAIVTEDALKVSISRIRRNLRRLGFGQEFLLSVRGLGYIFDPHAGDAAELPEVAARPFVSH